MTQPLPTADPASLGLDPAPLGRCAELISRHVAEGRHPGAQIAVARNGALALFQTFGDARLDPARAPARDDTLWLLYSNTKVITACAVWVLAEQGALRFSDRVADHVPGFEAHGKGEISIVQLLTHQGGFPNADVPREAWDDHDLLRRTVCGFTLEWTPGSRVHYHSRAAHWAAAVLIEAITRKDYRAVIREHVIEPLGAGDDLWVGVDAAHHPRCADMHEPAADGSRQVTRADENNAAFRLAGTPGGGGYGTARAMATFYQMLVQGGTLAGRRIVSPRMVAYVTRNFTGDRVDALHGHADAPRPRAALPRDHRDHTGAGDDRVAADVRTRRRRLLILLGRSRLGSLLRLPDEQPRPRPVARRPDGPGEQPGPRRHRVTKAPGILRRRALRRLDGKSLRRRQDE